MRAAAAQACAFLRAQLTRRPHAVLYDLGGAPPQTPPQVQFADLFQASTVAALGSAVGPQNGVFSTTCLVHCLTVPTAVLYTEYLANGVGLATAIGAWYFNGTAVVNINKCQARTVVCRVGSPHVLTAPPQGYPCVQACPAGSDIVGLSVATVSQATLTANGGRLTPASSEAVAQAAAAAEGAARTPPSAPGAAASWMNLGRH